MIRKRSFQVLMAGMMVAAAGCSGADSGNKANASSDQVEVSIADASYILTGEDDGVSEKDTGILMVNLKIKNTSDSALRISSGGDGIKLYKGEQELSPKNDVFVSDLGLEPDMSGSIGANKVKTIPAFFEVEKGQKYEIGITPRSDDYEEKPEEVTLKLDTKKYADSLDEMEDPAKALTAYIETIYLNKENPDYEKLVSADKDALQEEAKQGFNDGMKLIVYNSIPAQEMEEHYSSYKAVLAEKAEIKAETKAFANDRAVVKLDYTTVPLDDSYEIISDIQSEYKDKTGDFDSKKAQSFAMSKFEDVLNLLEVQPGSEPLEIKMIKKDGKWSVDTEDYNSEELVEVFARGSR